MTDEYVVERSVSRCGVHGVHVLRAGGPVEREEWIGREVPADAEQMEFFEYEDADTGMFHLKLWWKEKGAERYEWKR